MNDTKKYGHWAKVLGGLLENFEKGYADFFLGLPPPDGCNASYSHEKCKITTFSVKYTYWTITIIRFQHAELGEFVLIRRQWGQGFNKQGQVEHTLQHVRAYDGLDIPDNKEDMYVPLLLKMVKPLAEMIDHAIN